MFLWSYQIIWFTIVRLYVLIKRSFRVLTTARYSSAAGFAPSILPEYRWDLHGGLRCTCTSCRPVLPNFDGVSAIGPSRSGRADRASSRSARLLHRYWPPWVFSYKIIILCLLLEFYLGWKGFRFE